MAQYCRTGNCGKAAIDSQTNDAVKLRKISNSKSDLQGHWQWCYSMGHIRFPIRLPLQPCLDLAPFPKYYHISQNLKRSRDSEHILFDGNPIFEVPSFTDSKDMIGAKFKKTGHVTLTTHIRENLSSEG